MAKKKAKPLRHPGVNGTTSSPFLKIPEIPKGEIFIMDKEEIPVQGFYGRAVEVSYPKEFQAIDSLQVGQSGVFLQGKVNIINAVRTRIQKLSKKKFMVKKINNSHSRLWRVPDNSTTRIGGKKAIIQAAETNKARKKGTWGGPRVKGQGKPKQNKNGVPIVPQLTEVNNVQS